MLNQIPFIVLLFLSFALGFIVCLIIVGMVVICKDHVLRRTLDVNIEWKEGDGKFHIKKVSNGTTIQEIAIYDCESQRYFFFNPSKQGKHRRRLICEKVE